jgi:hypothetical protein
MTIAAFALYNMRIVCVMVASCMLLKYAVVAVIMSTIWFGLYPRAAFVAHQPAH